MKDLNLEEFYFDKTFIAQELEQLDLSCLSNGKNLRSRLVYQFGDFLEIPEDQLLKLGRVVELVHNATLTHDDVIDNSHTRRQSPSVPSLINNKKSVLLGDYMLAKALFELSELGNNKVVQELTLTLKSLVEGEWIQYENTNPYTTSKNIYETLSIKKTGSLFRWCFTAPLLLQNKNEFYPMLAEFGEKLGLIFQITDDILDFSPDSKKTYALDFSNNNLNFVLYFVGKSHPELQQNLLRTDKITDLSETNQKYIQEGIELAKEEVAKHRQRLNEILISLNKSLFKENQIYSELQTLVTLICERSY